jgi:hypothetical protein
VITIELQPARDNTYGIMFQSAHVYRMAGPGLHNRAFPHRIVVWDNTVRPNTGGRTGPGTYVDPNGKGTDAPTSWLTSSESVTITNGGTNTGTVASGQVYADDTLRVGGRVQLAYPDGTTSAPMVLTARPLADPALIPDL